VGTETEPGLVRRPEESPGRAGEHLLAAGERGRQPHEDTDVLLLPEIGHALVPDGARGKRAHGGAKRSNEIPFAFNGDDFGRADEGDMRNGGRLAWASPRHFRHALAVAGGNGYVQVVAHVAIIVERLSVFTGRGGACFPIVVSSAKPSISNGC
jgi:hypothetical protein